MKTILMSIQPKWVEKILNGEKTIEVRKFNIEPPFKVVMYCTNGYMLHDSLRCEVDIIESDVRSGKLNRFCLDLNRKSNKVEMSSYPFVNRKCVAEFVAKKAEPITLTNRYYKDGSVEILSSISKDKCGLCAEDLAEYLGTKGGYGYHISDLKIYDKPRELSEYFVYNKELEKRFIDGDDFCCHDATNEYGEAMTECDGENIHNCYRCWEEWSGWCHRITRPPQNYIKIMEV